MTRRFYRTNGTTTDTSFNIGDEVIFHQDQSGVWRMRQDERLHRCQELCIEVERSIRSSLFVENEYEYWSRCAPIFASEAGISPETPWSKELFDRALRESADDQQGLHRYLYLCDVEFLVSNIQSVLIELVSISGRFYQRLAELESDPVADGVRVVSSPESLEITILFHFIYIRMHSLFDYFVKLAAVAEKPAKDFSMYPKLTSKSFQYGHRKNLNMNGLYGSVFEDCEATKQVKIFRNRILHDGHLSPHQSIYERYDAGQLVERYLLLPDLNNERNAFASSTNRNSFYGDETKGNLDLPRVLQDIYARSFVTLDKIRDEFASTTARSTP